MAALQRLAMQALAATGLVTYLDTKSRARHVSQTADGCTVQVPQGAQPQARPQCSGQPGHADASSPGQGPILLILSLRWLHQNIRCESVC